MKRLTIILFLIVSNLISNGQISIPYEIYYHIENLPKSNEKISFNPNHPFLDYPDSISDIKSSYQFQMKLAVTGDSSLNQYIKYSMLSLDFEQKYGNYKKGAEIWYGVTKSSIPTVVGIYYKNSADSTLLYVFAGYSLTFFHKKSKTDLSRLISELLTYRNTYVAIL